jgi:hypothetical protein
VALEEGREFVSLVRIVWSADPFGLVFAAEGVVEIMSWPGFEILFGLGPGRKPCCSAIAGRRGRYGGDSVTEM